MLRSPTATHTLELIILRHDSDVDDDDTDNNTTKTHKSTIPSIESFVFIHHNIVDK